MGVSGCRADIPVYISGPMRRHAAWQYSVLEAVDIISLHHSAHQVAGSAASDTSLAHGLYMTHRVAKRYPSGPILTHCPYREMNQLKGSEWHLG